MSAVQLIVLAYYHGMPFLYETKLSHKTLGKVLWLDRQTKARCVTTVYRMYPTICLLKRIEELVFPQTSIRSPPEMCVCVSMFALSLMLCFVAAATVIK